MPSAGVRTGPRGPAHALPMARASGLSLRPGPLSVGTGPFPAALVRPHFTPIGRTAFALTRFIHSFAIHLFFHSLSKYVQRPHSGPAALWLREGDKGILDLSLQGSLPLACPASAFSPLGSQL